MRALLLVHNLPERGSYFRAMEIAKRLAGRGHDVELVHISEHKRYRPAFHKIEQPGPGTLVRVESPYRTFFNERQEGWGTFDVGFRCMHGLGQRFDLVYGFSHKPDCVLPSLASRLRGAKIVLDWSDWWGGEQGLYKSCVVSSDAFQALPEPLRLLRRGVFAAESFWEPRVYGLADAVTLISEEYLLHPRAPRSLREKSFILHSGAPLEAIRPERKELARAACGLSFPPGAVVLGYLANFHTDERLLLEAFGEVCSQRPEVHLLAVGSDFEKSDPELHERIKGRVHHVGRRPFSMIGSYLASADVLLLPLSDVLLNRARYPHKLSDYVAAGRPIVACEVGETGRLLRRFGLGKLTPPTPGDFARGILEMLDRREQWQALGEQTRRGAEEHFNWDTMAERLFGFLGEKLRLEF